MDCEAKVKIPIRKRVIHNKFDRFSQISLGDLSLGFGPAENAVLHLGEARCFHVEASVN